MKSFLKLFLDEVPSKQDLYKIAEACGLVLLGIILVNIIEKL